MQTKSIPIKDIKVIENHRTNIDKTHLDELMQSIKQRGLLTPIGVAENGKGFILRFGHRRLEACRKLGLTHIDAVVTVKIEEEKLLLENLTENMQRKDPSFAELGRVISKLERTLKLSAQEIAVRLGMPLGKIRQIVEVYDSLPEKFRKRVVFMEKGGGRKTRKGCIPAGVALKIVAMKREHGLNNKGVDGLFKSVVDTGMDKLDLDNVGGLMGAGMTAKEALENVKKFGVYTVDIVAKHEEISQLMEKYQLPSRQHLFKKILYGELPAVSKPAFVQTAANGIKAVMKKEKIDHKPFERILGQLINFSKAGKLTEEQINAIQVLQKTPRSQWTEAHHEQIQNIYREINEKKGEGVEQPKSTLGARQASKK